MNAQSLTLERLRRLHAPAYRALMLGAYARHPDAFTSYVDERDALPLSWWEARLSEDRDARELVVGAFAGDRLAGVAGLTFQSRRKLAHRATLFGMYVDEAFRQLGLGRRLVVAALDLARSRPGIRVVQLTVSDGNGAAQTLYERCGFVAFGVEPLAIASEDGFVAKVHMWLDIDSSIRTIR